MNWRSSVSALAVAISSIALAGAAGDEAEKKDPAAVEEKKGPPFGEAPKAKESEPKPPERSWTVKSGEFELSVSMKPGIPDPDQLTEVMISANAIPKTPHPRFGSRVPLEGATVLVEVTSPAGEVVAKYVAHAMPLSSGRYGLHLTPKQEGLYTLGVRGTTADGKSFSGDVKLPVKVWPLPAELQGGGDVSDKGGSRRPIKL